MASSIPANRAAFSLEQIAHATNGRVLQRGAGVPTVGVFSDTRAVLQGTAFVALSGERYDGHDFVASAVERGARTLIVSREVSAASDVAIVLVRDTRTALGRLARTHRLRWAEEVPEVGQRALVAITGSAGKTTTKNLLGAVLDAAAPGTVHATAGNLNNDIGVPMTLFGLEPAHRTAVVEIGTSAPGEIASLADIAVPDVGVLTLVASAHTERLGSIEQVALEKGALLAALPANGLAVVNADDARAVAQLSRTSARNVRTYGFAEHADYRVVARRSRGAAGARVTVARRAGGPVLELDSPLLGDAGALALAAALAVGDWLHNAPLGLTTLQSAMSMVGESLEGRLKVLTLADGSLLIDDSYNANPASMRSSIAAAAELAHDGQRDLVLVLGEMRELGALAEVEHRALATAVQAARARHVVLVGEGARALADQLTRDGTAVIWAANANDAAAIALTRANAGDVILVKGSRGVQTERVVHALAEARGVSEGERA